MKRLLSGLLPFAAVLALGSCSGDPTGDLQGTPARVDASPTSFVIDSGSSENVDLQVLDAQGNPLAGVFTFAITDPTVVSVEQDTAYRPGLGRDRLTQRYILTSLKPGFTPVTFSTSGASGQVRVLTPPPFLPIVYSSATPNVNDEVTITAVGYKFRPTVSVTHGGDVQLITAVAADSNSVTFRASPAGPGTITVAGVTFASLTSTPLTVESATGITVGPAITSLPGTDAVATAPLIGVPPPGVLTSTLSDAGTFAAAGDCITDQGFPCRIYRFVVTQAGDYDFSGTWNNLADLGLYFTDDVGTGAGAFDAHGDAAGSSPEEGTLTLAVGTYRMYVVSFAPAYPPPNNVNPTELTVTVTSH